MAPQAEPQVVKVIFNDAAVAIIEVVAHIQAIVVTDSLSFSNCQKIRLFLQRDL